MSKVFTITEGLENMGALRTGGQGSVYKGRRFGPILTAVKLLPTPVHTESEEDKNFRSFLNEVEKLKKVNEEPNPNVVKILHSGITESGSFPFIEMEFIDGPDLEELLRTPNDPVFTLNEVIKVAAHLANALAHCHRVGVKHGDIKSNNVKFNVHTGNYVLLDFGLSAMSDEQRRTSIRHAGAIEFMAPEQSEGQLLFETDIYSYGIILYELLAGQVPFPLTDNGQRSRNEVLVGHLEQAPPDLTALRKKNLPASWPETMKVHEMQIPHWLLQVIDRCLQKLPENRYSDGMQLHQAIVSSSVAAGGIGMADPAELNFLRLENERLQTALRSHQGSGEHTDQDAGVVVISKPVFFVLALGVAFMAALLSYFLLFRGQVKAEKPRTEIRRTPADSPKEQPVKRYSWQKAQDSLIDTGEAEEQPVQLKPVPRLQQDTTVMDLDTTVHF